VGGTPGGLSQDPGSKPRCTVNCTLALKGAALYDYSRYFLKIVTSTFKTAGEYVEKHVKTSFSPKDHPISLYTVVLTL